MGYGFPMTKSTFTYRRMQAVSQIPFHFVFVGCGVVLLHFTIVLNVALGAFDGAIIDFFGVSYLIYLYFTALAMIALHIFCIKISLVMLNWKTLYRRQLTWRLLIYSAFILLLVENINFIIFSQTTASQMLLIKQSISGGMSSVLEKYRTDPKVKESIDRTQLKYQCCGAYNNTDWYNISWIHKDFLNRERADVSVDRPDTSPTWFWCTGRQACISWVFPVVHVDGRLVRCIADVACGIPELSHMKGGLYVNRIVPFSCCSIKYSNVSCDPYAPIATEDAINKVGCAAKFSEFLSTYNLDVLTGLSMFLWIFGLPLLYSFRMMQTATDVAIIWGDPTQLSFAYLCYTGAPPHPPNRIKSKAEFDRRQDQLNSLAYDYYDVFDIALRKRRKKTDKKVTMYKKLPKNVKQLKERMRERLDERGDAENINTSAAVAPSSIWKRRPISSTSDTKTVDYERVWHSLAVRGIVPPLELVLRRLPELFHETSSDRGIERWQHKPITGYTALPATSPVTSYRTVNSASSD